MTALDQRPGTASEDAETDERIAPPVQRDELPSPAPTSTPGLTAGRAVALTCVLAGLLVLGFLAYLFAFSSVSMDRQQANLRKTLNRQLASATAPVESKSTDLGAPVAAMDIPALHIRTMIVVEGTSSRQLMSGPGLLPASALPGQVGESVILGKRSTFGAPFADVGTLKLGDRIRVTTGLGVATYEVSSFGYQNKLPPANSTNHLLLYTADSFTWSPKSIVVSADLISQPVTGGADRPGVLDAQRPGHRDYDGSLIPLAGWSQLLLLVAVVGTLALYRWPRWPVVLCVGPVLVAVVWSVYENAAGLLPNVL